MTQTESSTSETPLIDLAYQKLASIVGGERAQVGSLPLKSYNLSHVIWLVLRSAVGMTHSLRSDL